ncbi:MAG: aminotransferase class V-fold PLP-dependent enzyme, partial [Actinomycetota bacterium]
MRGPADLLAWRDEFPAVKNTVFLGAHTLAPLSRRVRAAMDGFLDAWERKPSPERLWFEDIIPEMRRLEGLYARAIGADPDEVALTPSVSTGLSSLASCLDFGERDEIVISRQEFPTDCHVWLAQGRRGARVRWIDGKDEHAFAEAIGPQTVAVSASHVSYLD